MSTATGFAEMFEWADGNPNNEDRTGETVALFQGKIVLAKDCPYHLEPEDIIGVIGGDNTAVAAISNASEHEWHGKHLRDEFNRLVWEDQVMVEWIVNGYRHWYELDRLPDGIVVPEDATYYREWNGHPLRREILSEEYKNPGNIVKPYLPRWDRTEWGIVIIVGRAMVKEGSICHPGWRRLTHTIDGNYTNIAAEWLIK